LRFQAQIVIKYKALFIDSNSDQFGVTVRYQLAPEYHTSSAVKSAAAGVARREAPVRPEPGGARSAILCV
jgi:hypothetical protein